MSPLCSRLVAALPVLLLLLVRCGVASPLGLFSFVDPTLSNGTSLLAALALAHAEHAIAKANALATLLTGFANITEIALFG